MINPLYLFLKPILLPMITKNLLIVILFLIVENSLAQNTKHQVSSGKIIFDITYPETQLDEKTMANLPTESVMFFKNDKVKIDVNMPMSKTTIISDNKTGEGTMLLDMMGNKWAIKMNKEQLLKEKETTNGKPKVELTHESKVIAGYNCTKAIITINTKLGEKSFDAWFTKDLKVKNSFSSQIEGIDGFLMEFYNTQNAMNMKMTARSVEPMEVADSEFSIPDGYQQKTMDELKGMGRGGK